MPKKSAYSPDAWARSLERERERKRALRAVSRDADHAYYERAMLDPDKRKRKAESTSDYRKRLRETDPQAYRAMLDKYNAQRRERRNGPDRESILEQQRAISKKNAARLKVGKDAWRAKNWERLRDVHNGYWRKRRALLLNAEGNFTQDEWLRIVERQNGKCFDCGEERKMTIGHLVPLCKGGSNWATNIVAQCQRCNSSQGQRIHPSLSEGT